MNNKTINKIKKLFALGSNNTNEFESESAMKIAKKLLDKHNLSVYDLKEQEEIGIKIEDSKNNPWIRNVYYHISKLYDCQIVINKDEDGTKFMIIGTESNRATASIVIKHCIKTITDSCVGMGNGYRNSASIAIGDQVDSILLERNNSKEEVIPGSGLVPIDISRKMELEIQEWIGNIFGDTIENKKTYAKVDSRGYSVGRDVITQDNISYYTGMGFKSNVSDEIYDSLDEAN